MTQAIGLHEFFFADARINLCGRQAAVTEHFLHAPDVGAVVEKVSGKAVSELVRRDIHHHCQLPGVFVDQSKDAACRKRRAEMVEKNSGLLPLAAGRCVPSNMPESRHAMPGSSV